MNRMLFSKKNTIFAEESLPDMKKDFHLRSEYIGYSNNNPHLPTRIQ